MNSRYQKNTQVVHPNRVQFPDNDLPSEYGDASQIDVLERINKSFSQKNERIKDHMKIVDFLTKDFKKDSDFIKSNLDNPSQQYIDEDTGLLYGIGFDTFIHKINRDRQEILSKDDKIDNLVKKLGYLDMREFLMLNRYILEAKNHHDLLIQTKAKFLEEALNKFTKEKREEIKDKLSIIDSQQKNQKEKTDEKVEFLLSNYSNLNDIFYENYYKIKDIGQREIEKSLEDYDKYEILKELSNNNKNISLTNDYNNDKLNLNKRGDSNSSKNEEINPDDPYSYFDEVINRYRKNRMIDIKVNSNDIKIKINKFIDNQNMNDTLFNYHLKDIFAMIKFYTFFNKYKKIYVPTNMETERLINKFLKEKALKKINYESVQENDPLFSPLLKSGNLSQSDFEIKDNKTKETYMQWEKLKRNYFDAKYEHEKKKVIENVDKNIVADLGYILLESIVSSNEDNDVKDRYDVYINEVFPGIRLKDKFSLVESIIEKHYKSFKLDYMYNYLDFFSNKYKIRRQIAKEMKERTSLEEINNLLNDLTETELSITGSKSKRNFSVSDLVDNTTDKIVPDFFDILTKQNNRTTVEKEMKNAVESIDNHFDKIPFETDQYDRYEIEAYKGIKNDPFFKHYLKTHFSFFLETYNEATLNTPFYTRGFKKSDYIKWQQMTIPSNLSLRNKNSLEEKSTKKENEIYDKVMNNFGNITRFTNISESDRLMKDGVYYGFGKRKRARANAYIKPGSGKVTVNGIPVHKYISDTVYRGKLFAPLVLTETSAKVDVKLIMFGGGISGQMDAAVPAISRALVRMNPEFAEILAKSFFLTHDPRNVEPKKPGRIKARKGYVYNRR